MNIFYSLLQQFVALLCGFVVPRLLLGAFGSEAYGATSSIANFLSYITLLEGGIGGVARAALYKPLAENNTYEISAVVSEIKRFFRVIAYAFIGYVIVLACSFKSISGLECFDWITSALLVVIISFSTFAQYFIGISNAVLLQADQRSYITQILSIITTILNTVFIVILIKLNCSLLIVKLVSSCIFVMKPIAMWVIVKKEYSLVSVDERHKELLNQKWTGLGQHIAYFLHSNTDIAVLTIFSDLTSVAIYSVHNMVVFHIQNIASSFSSGMEALFGDMLAKGEHEELKRTFNYYETLISVITIFLFSVTAVLIVPFISLYTAGIKDANYYHPAFAFVLTLASVLYCLRMPYHSMTIAAGHFKQTRWAAYGEAAINIGLSILLVINFNLIGVAIGTVVATAFRFIYYAFYLSNNIMNRKILLFVKRMIVNGVEYVIIYLGGQFIVNKLPINNYFDWILAAIMVSILALFIVLLFTFLFYKTDFMPVINKLTRKAKFKQE